MSMQRILKQQVPHLLILFAFAAAQAHGQFCPYIHRLFRQQNPGAYIVHTLLLFALPTSAYNNVKLRRQLEGMSRRTGGCECTYWKASVVAFLMPAGLASRSACCLISLFSLRLSLLASSSDVSVTRT